MEKKTLYRSTSNKMILGVAAGTAKYFGMDLTLARVLWAIVGVCTGIGWIAYVIMGFVLPVDPEDEGNEAAPTVFEQAAGQAADAVKDATSANSTETAASAEEKTEVTSDSAE